LESVVVDPEQRPPSVRVIFEWYETSLTVNKTRDARQVPAILAGWIIAEPGEPADIDGYRPLGQVRDLLDDLVLSSALSVQSKLTMRARFGLAAWPTLRSPRPLGRRVPADRVRGRGGLKARRLRQIVDEALRHLDEVGSPRPA